MREPARKNSIPFGTSTSIYKSCYAKKCVTQLKVHYMLFNFFLKKIKYKLFINEFETRLTRPDIKVGLYI